LPPISAPTILRTAAFGAETPGEPIFMTELEQIVEIEKIRKVRVLYSHYFDSNELDRLADLFTEDVICEFGPHGTWRGKQELRRNYEQAHAHWDTQKRGPYPYLHVTTNHWVELTGPESAEGRCYLIDNVTADPQRHPLLLLGVYDDEYKKVDGVWKIHRTRIDFIWPERNLVGGAPGRRIPPKP
jgi:hypothetical protein